MKPISLALLLFVGTAISARVGPCPPNHLQVFFSQWHDTIQNITQQYCTMELSAWVKENLPPFLDNDSSNSWALVSCILDHMDNLTLADLGTSAILLGLLPTVLSLAASSTIETGMLSLKRPGLALLLSAASPTVNSLRVAKYRDPSHLLRKDEKGVLDLRSRDAFIWPTVLLQYIIALASLANILELCWELCVKGVFTVNTDGSIYVPYIWVCVGLLIHLIGWATLRLRVNLVEPEPQTRSFARAMKLELTLCSHHEKADISTKPERLIFVFAEWFASTLTLANIFFGTFFFGSIVLIGPNDAVIITVRLFASITVSRMVLMFESSGLRHSLSDAT